MRVCDNDDDDVATAGDDSASSAAVLGDYDASEGGAKFDLPPPPTDDDNAGDSASSSARSSAFAGTGDVLDKLSRDQRPPLSDKATSALARQPPDKPHLILKHMGLEYVPDQVMQLTCVQVLDLRSNHLTVIPDALGDRLGALRTLRLSYNQCSELPATLTRLTALNELDIGYNDFGKFGLSPVIAQLKPLGNLLMQWNSLEQVSERGGCCWFSLSLCRRPNTLRASCRRKSVEWPTSSGSTCRSTVCARCPTR